MTHLEDAFIERDRTIKRLTRDAQGLVGATIAAAEARPHMDVCDGANVIRLTTTDGRVFDIQGGYGEYTGHSCDEYVETIWIEQAKP